MLVPQGTQCRSTTPPPAEQPPAPCTQRDWAWEAQREQKKSHFWRKKGKEKKKKAGLAPRTNKQPILKERNKILQDAFFSSFFFFNSLEGVGDGKEEPRWQQEGSPGARSCAGRGGAAGRAEHTPH